MQESKPIYTQLASDEMATISGVEYTASMWIRAEAGSPGVGGAVRFSTAAGAGAQYGGDFTVSEEWQEVIFTFTANDVLTRIVLDLGATADAVYFIDDVSVLEPPQ